MPASTKRQAFTNNWQFNEFQYKVYLTPELSTQLLSMGESVEVLEPMELKEKIKKRIKKCLTRYK